MPSATSCGVVAGDPLDHAGPERDGAHLGGHQVRRVEPEDRVLVLEISADSLSIGSSKQLQRDGPCWR